VAALQTMRGMALVNAATLTAELCDLSRFADARQLMAYLGLVPSEHSSGASVKRGGITKARNGAARRLLIEAAWTYRFPARLSRELLLRQENQSRAIREIAWNAPLRLCARYRKLARAGQAGQCRHHRDRPRAGRLRVGHRPASAGPGSLIRRPRDHPREAPANHPTRFFRAGLGARSRSGEPLRPLSAGSPQASRPRQLRDASTVIRFRSAHQSLINRRLDDRASCLPGRAGSKCFQWSHKFTRLHLATAEMRVDKT
jgi:hypothetical protein